MRDVRSKELVNIQTIGTAGDKRSLYGGGVADCYYGLASKPSNVLLIAEGWATAASLHESTGYAVAISFGASNLEAVARGLRERYPDVRIVLAADRDLAGC
jgi:putative DNA primase/helicase